MRARAQRVCGEPSWGSRGREGAEGGRRLLCGCCSLTAVLQPQLREGGFESVLKGGNEETSVSPDYCIASVNWSSVPSESELGARRN